MGSGKSTVGRELSSAAGLTFIDLDKYIQTREGRTVNDIFNNEGEDYLYPADYFVFVNFPQTIEQTLLRISLPIP